MKYRASISIFSALILVCTISLVCGLLEAARLVGLRWQLQCISKAGVDSCMSEYQKYLWQTFRILGLEYIDDEDIEKTLDKYDKFYFDNTQWFSYGNYKNKLDNKYYLLDDDGKYLEKEILDFMKYEILDITKFDLKDIDKNIHDAKKLDDTSEKYYDNGKMAIKVQELAIKIAQLNEKIYKDAQEMKEAINDEYYGRVTTLSNKLDKELTELSKVFNNYKNQYQKYCKDIDKKKKENSYSDSTDIDDTINNFDKYKLEEEKRYKELEAIVEQNLSFKNDIKECGYLAEDIEEIDDYEDDTDEKSELIQELQELSTNIRIQLYKEGITDGDKEVKKALFDLKDLLKKGFLNMVVDENKISNKELTSIKNRLVSTEYKKGSKKTLDPVSKLVISEYFGRYLSSFTEKKQNDNKIDYEMEYILAKKDSDKDILYSAVMELIMLRTGCNLLNILSDVQKMSEVKNMALLVLGSFALPILIPIMIFLIVGIWAMAESIIDVRMLLGGKKVSLYKLPNEWKLPLKDLLRFNLVYKNLADNAEGTNGFTYNNYLKMLIALMDDGDRNIRFADIIQMHFINKDIDIDLHNLLYGMDTNLQANTRNLFSSLFTFYKENEIGEFKIKVYSHKSY